MKKILLVASAVLLAGSAFAQHVHQKGPNGGAMEDVAGVHVEMVATGRTISFNVYDESNKPISTKGFSGSALLTSDGDRETLTLVATDNALKAEAKKDIPKGAAVSVTLKAADGKSGQAKFKN
ncbi:hypothetical protein SR870_19210 [Rhodopseudomonas palustris]|uniref:hypothetical protein n=1 Tax=Rhodopseudomonas palustris TaxID=1076 RepID=UPI002ACD3F53|nr:hypothetical protein [Rhodopseudomonas palustris]WQG98796.1 hypothetical protein SR870_19210 [Rhodopseudomonas palustris]